MHNAVVNLFGCHVVFPFLLCPIENVIEQVQMDIAFRQKKRGSDMTNVAKLKDNSFITSACLTQNTNTVDAWFVSLLRKRSSITSTCLEGWGV